MAITSKDIKIYQAQDNTDNDSGGGSRTGTEIQDGDINNLFPDISRIDTVSGDVGLRKVFPTVTTTNRDVYYGAHAMIRKTPTDPNVSSLLFHTDDPHDKRTNAQDRIESYVTASYEETFWLYGNHVEGSKSVTFLQDLSSQTPDVGEVYLLQEADASNFQYIRVVNMVTDVISIPYSNGGNVTNYDRRRIICEIDQPLTYKPTGSAFLPEGRHEDAAITFATQVSNAAKFYGTAILTVDAAADDLSITVDSIYEQLVPASRKLTPLVNQSALVTDDGIISTGKLTQYTGYEDDYQFAISVNSAVTPNTVTKAFSNASIQDDGTGNLIDVSNNNEIVGTVNYRTGDFYAEISTSDPVFEFTEANLIPSPVKFTDGIKITQENQNLVHVRNLSPIPTNGALYIDYRAQGKWYRISANYDNSLGVDSNIGAGRLDDNGDGTGTVSVTLGSLPDIDSTIIFSWGSAERINERSALFDSAIKKALVFDLGVKNIDPLSFVMGAIDQNSGVVSNITADAGGVLSDASNYAAAHGKLDVVNGLVYITGFDNYHQTRFKDGEQVTIDFDYTDTDAQAGIIKKVASKTPSGDEVLFTEADTTVDFDTGDTGIDRQTLHIDLVLEQKTADFSVLETKRLTLKSDTNGNLRNTIDSDTFDYGVVNSNGTVTINKPTRQYYKTKDLGLGGGQTPWYSAQTIHGYVVGKVNVQYKQGAITYENSRSLNDLVNNLCTLKIETFQDVIGEVSFSLNYDTGEELQSARMYFSKNGSIFSMVNPNIQIGTINYASGDIEMNYRTPLHGMPCKFRKLMTDELGISNTDFVYEQTFRTSATKLVTSSFQMRYETINGTNSATTDQNGVFTGDDIDTVESYVDTETGMAHVEFTDALLPEATFYDAVSESSLPLDPELLGLNPVRLPSDGRVPIFDNGRHLVIFHEATTAVSGGTPSNGQVQVLARSGQSYIEVIDTNGKRLDTDEFTADRDAGSVTFNDPVNLVDKYGAALTAPFSIVDRVEDMVLATDVQITGQIDISAALTHAYPKDETKVASTLVFGDTGARVYNLFSQELWNSSNPVWSDDRIGDPTTAQYNEIQYPIQIDNESSVAGRWAIIFKSPTTVDVVEEKLGVLETNISISIEDVAPINVATGQPYFTMPKEGFGAGWITDNVVRFNTDSGTNNMWVVRTVQAGALSEEVDNIELEIRGDAN